MDAILVALDALYKFVVLNAPVLSDKIKNIVADLFVVYAILQAALPLFIAFLTALWDWVLGLLNFSATVRADYRSLRSGQSLQQIRAARSSQSKPGDKPGYPKK